MMTATTTDIECWLHGAIEVPCEMILPTEFLGWRECKRMASWLVYVVHPCGCSSPAQHFMCQQCKMTAIDELKLIQCSIDCEHAVEIRWLERIR